MSADFTPVSVHEALDVGGWLEDARGPGCYALRLRVPDSAEDAHRTWLQHFEATPGDDALTRMAQADRVAYVGASKRVYDRLMDHAEGEKRKAAVLRAFPAVEVVRVWPMDTPFEREWGAARDLAGDGWTVWVNGDLVE
ncbi:hypothetical protein M197_gp28 [Haloarcula hispanica tailed virus 2]|uniref:Uncharacterized protein n=1 Tax=Haloarcula hispanica tailed virus 2 TaxID=1273751 RepID=R4TM02_9CAUD|nr:hypothetical protein M197_gp28 [Haloarcula hispanica tailed virus 2]AGM11193.1 hypothetical protein HHTV2_28 [Haloarcula hispanica tailed virus 2]